MKSVRLVARMLVASAIASGIGLAVVPVASADSDDAAQANAPAPVPAPSAPTRLTPGSPDTDPAAVDACKQFAAAMNFAATNYEDFAYATAGSGNYVDYADPTVTSSNVAGRTALREAAAAALTASQTPRLQPDIAAPMRSWSLDAAKLLVIMGVHRGGNALNAAAAALNNDGHNAQMACAGAGVHA